MENNIKVSRVHRALSWFYGLCLLLVALATITVMQDDGDLTVMLVVMAITGGIFSLHYSVARGAKRKKGWAKSASTIIAIFMLLGFPIGTIIGVYLLLNNSDWN